MFTRDTRRPAALPRSHVFISVARGEGIRTFAVRPHTLGALVVLAAFIVIWSGAATAYIAFHDNMLAALLIHEARMRNAYEDRIAEARAELDRVASRQLLDQNSFEGRMHDLLSRQARIEQHDRIVEALAKEASGHAAPAEFSDAAKGRTADESANPATSAEPGAPAPKGESLSEAAPSGRVDRGAAALAASASDPSLAAAARLGLVDVSLDRLERDQMATLDGIADAAHRAASRIDGVIARTGLSPSQLNLPGAEAAVGGPFIPAAGESGLAAFDRSFARAATQVDRVHRLRRVMAYLPVREPLVGELSMSSPFGYRPDPFLGRPALHPGVDLVQPYGSQIKATAAGRVTRAGWLGGYGQMVEIDHGNGLVTRYGHMSEVLVAEGDAVRAGEILGRIGSSGRSTGPHLHYEVRIDGEAVDPERFLDAGAGVGNAASL